MASDWTSNATRNVYQIGVDLNKPEQTLKFVMVLCAIIFTIAVVFFTLIRTKFQQIYAPRLLIENKMFGIGNLPKKLFFSWVTLAFSTKDDDLFVFAGFDALVYIRFLRLMLKFALCTMPYGLIVLLPLNAVGKYELPDGLNRLSMSNIVHGSGHLWAHWLAVWLYSLLVCFFCLQEWKVYIKYRQRYLKKGLHHQFSILVNKIPAEMSEDVSFFQYMDELFPNKVASACIVRDLSEWNKLIKQHDNLVKKWEDAKFYEETGRKRKTTRATCCGPKIDAITEYEKELELLQERLVAEKANEAKVNLHCGFVVFKSIETKQFALKSVWNNKTMNFIKYPAPQPSEVKWRALKYPYTVRKCLEILGYVAVFFLVIFWAVPITFISTLTKLESLSVEFKWLDSILANSSTMLKSFIQGVLPVILIELFSLILPYILFFIATIQGQFSKSRCAEMVFKCLFIFQTFNTFFIYILSGSVLQDISKIVQEPLKIPSVLAKSLPSQAGFYVNYLAITSFVGLALEITRIWPLIRISITLKWFAKTTRQKMNAWKPRRAKYEAMYSQELLFFLIGLSFSVLSPIIIPFVVLYYAFGYVVWSYQLLHVYIPEYGHGGKFWTFVFNRMMVCVLVFQLLMVGVFLLKEVWFAAVFLAPLIVVTVAFWLYVNETYVPYSKYLSLQETVGMKYAEQSFLEEVKTQYIMDYNIPDVFQLSTDKEPPSEEYIPITSIDNGDTDEDDNRQEIKESNRALRYLNHLIRKNTNC